MLELRALHAQTDVIGLGGVQQGFRFGDVEAAGYAAFVASLGQVESFLLQVDIIFQDDAILVDETRHDVILGHVGFDGEQHVFVVGDGSLHLRPGRFHRAPDAAPQVDFVADVRRQNELVIGISALRASRRHGTCSGNAPSAERRLSADLGVLLRTRNGQTGAGCRARSARRPASV